MNWEGWYEVSNLGKIRRIKQGRGARVGQQRRQKISREGYRHVALMRDGHRQDCTVHSLVTAAFIGPRPEGHEINHKNLDKGDNRVENLEYVTPDANKAHAVLAGAFGVKGEANGSAKLTPDLVRAIRLDHEGGKTIAELSIEHSVTWRAIKMVVQRKTWKHV